jgi:hypothetical protein
MMLLDRWLGIVSNDRDERAEGPTGPLTTVPLRLPWNLNVSTYRVGLGLADSIWHLRFNPHTDPISIWSAVSMTTRTSLAATQLQEKVQARRYVKLVLTTQAS